MDLPILEQDSTVRGQEPAPQLQCSRDPCQAQASASVSPLRHGGRDRATLSGRREDSEQQALAARVTLSVFTHPTNRPDGNWGVCAGVLASILHPDLTLTRPGRPAPGGLFRVRGACFGFMGPVSGSWPRPARDLAQGEGDTSRGSCEDRPRAARVQTSAASPGQPRGPRPRHFRRHVVHGPVDEEPPGRETERRAAGGASVTGFGREQRADRRLPAAFSPSRTRRPRLPLSCDECPKRRQAPKPHAHADLAPAQRF